MGKKEDLGSFMSRLAKDNMSQATKETIESLKAELQAEKQAQFKEKIRVIFSNIQSKVRALRDLREREKLLQAEIKAFEKQANDLAAEK